MLSRRAICCVVDAVLPGENGHAVSCVTANSHVSDSRDNTNNQCLVSKKLFISAAADAPVSCG